MRSFTIRDQSYPPRVIQLWKPKGICRLGIRAQNHDNEAIGGHFPLRQVRNLIAAMTQMCDELGEKE